ncbi:uncharacterized protein B0I36DRAFT_235 [Microdochium trichocladiopsis]|uniref:Uncharacterized protein n=1 Tax=Microdochium trichocladiopsis TaxID=1682393 RepID=A0A9P8YGL0_9PEZI|nr:uncharacterized protein B0I36DRAFT_235 [Microdochium trichocladiopsis]KAH7039593.1 hypothetical protein B0I36DRAFT_235 [Microdochium trichocladiopsis]
MNFACTHIHTHAHMLQTNKPETHFHVPQSVQSDSGENNHWKDNKDDSKSEPEVVRVQRKSKKSPRLADLSAETRQAKCARGHIMARDSVTGGKGQERIGGEWEGSIWCPVPAVGYYALTCLYFGRRERQWTETEEKHGRHNRHRNRETEPPCSRKSTGCLAGLVRYLPWGVVGVDGSGRDLNFEGGHVMRVVVVVALCPCRCSSLLLGRPWSLSFCSPLAWAPEYLGQAGRVSPTRLVRTMPNVNVVVVPRGDCRCFGEFKKEESRPTDRMSPLVCPL